MTTYIEGLRAQIEQLRLAHDYMTEEVDLLKQSEQNQFEIATKACEERDIALEELRDLKEIHQSLNTNLRKLGSGAAFLPAMEIALRDTQIATLTQKVADLTLLLKGKGNQELADVIDALQKSA